jgi:hypothetical protein
VAWGQNSVLFKKTKGSEAPAENGGTNACNPYQIGVKIIFFSMHKIATISRGIDIGIDYV